MYVLTMEPGLSGLLLFLIKSYLNYLDIKVKHQDIPKWLLLS